MTIQPDAAVDVAVAFLDCEGVKGHRFQGIRRVIVSEERAKAVNAACGTGIGPSDDWVVTFTKDSPLVAASPSEVMVLVNAQTGVAGWGESSI